MLCHQCRETRNGGLRVAWGIRCKCGNLGAEAPNTSHACPKLRQSRQASENLVRAAGSVRHDMTRHASISTLFAAAAIPLTRSAKS